MHKTFTYLIILGIKIFNVRAYRTHLVQEQSYLTVATLNYISTSKHYILLPVVVILYFCNYHISQNHFKTQIQTPPKHEIYVNILEYKNNIYLEFPYEPFLTLCEYGIIFIRNKASKKLSTCVRSCTRQPVVKPFFKITTFYSTLNSNFYLVNYKVRRLCKYSLIMLLCSCNESES